MGYVICVILYRANGTLPSLVIKQNDQWTSPSPLSGAQGRLSNWACQTQGLQAGLYVATQEGVWGVYRASPESASRPGLWLLIGSIKTQMASHQCVMEAKPHLSGPTKVLVTLATSKAWATGGAHPRDF